MATAKAYRKSHTRKIRNKKGVGMKTVKVKSTHTTYKKKR